MEHDDNTSSGRQPRFLTKGFFLWIALTAFILGGFYSGWLAMPSTLGWATTLAASSLSERLAPVEFVAAASATPPDWKNLERVNVLILGVDRRADEGDVPSRTDTIMLVTVDPKNKTAGMLSIPRDLWVPIPLKPGSTVLQDRINTANVYGDMYDYPGGGAALAKETVQYNLGVRVHYYVMIDFEGFERIINTLNGVEVDLETPLVDNFYPTANYGTMRVAIPAGRQRLDGQQALWYVRSRHADSDFGRMHRQQRFLLAMRERILQLDVLPKIPSLWAESRGSVKTDMSLSDLLTLGRVTKDIPAEKIVSGALDGEYIQEMITRDGAAILLPSRTKMREIVEKVFFDPPAEKLVEAEGQEEEVALVEVLNGTKVAGLAARTAKHLEGQGLREVAIGDAPGGPYQTTQIQNFGGKVRTAALIASALKLPPERVVTLPKPEGTEVDIRVILGSDVP